MKYASAKRTVKMSICNRRLSMNANQPNAFQSFVRRGNFNYQTALTTPMDLEKTAQAIFLALAADFEALFCLKAALPDSVDM